MTEAVPGFEKTTFAYAGRSHDVYRAGTGPAVVVLPELPGLHPGMAEFGRRLVGEGYTVFLVSLFGRDGAPAAVGPTMRSLAGVCVSREFSLLSSGTTRANTWLCGLAAYAHEQCGGPGVGAIGMCFTGGFALTMAVEPAVLVSVLSQPATPAPVSAARRAALPIDRADLDAVRKRAREDGLCVLGLRFTGDRTAPAERFATLRRELGDAFTGIEIDSSRGNPAAVPTNAHSVLTVHLVDEQGHPTREAFDRMLAFLGRRLRP
jgi:dienelactone hydrolase